MGGWGVHLGCLGAARVGLRVAWGVACHWRHCPGFWRSWRLLAPCPLIRWVGWRGEGGSNLSHRLQHSSLKQTRRIESIGGLVTHCGICVLPTRCLHYHVAHD